MKIHQLVFISFCFLLNCTTLKYNTNIYESSTLKIKQLSKNTYIHISYLKTKSFGNVACNGMIFIDQKEAIVFDTPSYDEDALELIQWIEQKKKATIIAVVLNHFHIDCLGGLAEFHKKNIPSYATHQTIQLAKADDATVPQNGFDETLVLQIGKEKVINEYFGEAHTKDNIVSYLPNENTLFGGCQIKKLKAGKGNLNDANIKEWANTVRRIKEKYPNLKTVIPGHGNHGGIELLDYTIEMFDTSK